MLVSYIREMLQKIQQPILNQLVEGVTELTVFEPAPAGDSCHSTSEVVIVTGHADGHNVRVKGDG